jgi:hypothetical protein
MATTRFQTRTARGSWYVLDTSTGRVWTGLTSIGARQLADHLNRRAA